MNVADDCTRGMASHELTDQCRWLSGPPFLKLPECNWPNQDVPMVDESELEIKPSVLAVSTMSNEALINWERFSRLSKFVRVLGWCVRYKYKLQCKVRRTEPVEDRRSEFLSVEDLEEATKALCMQAQTEAFPQEYSNLLIGKPVPNGSQLLSLQPIMKDRLLKVGGRLDKAPIASEAKHQIILSSNHPLSRLIVKDIHERNRHVGREHTLALVRQRYWIIHGKGLVRMVIKECFFCMKRRTNPQVPLMAPLPKARFAAYQAPFTNTGIDYFGPMNVKRGRVTEKRWGCLFTCLTTRAVHLELAGDLSADAFILALRRFRARRGDPKTMLSDNGTNFTGANRELAEALEELKQSNVAKQLAAEGIAWRFNPPSAPHMGGVFESMVKQVKRVLKAVLGNRVFGEDTLHTVLVETEAILNSRPLTANSDDPSDYEALTPNHFLVGKVSPNLTPGQFDEREVDSRTRWRAVQAVTEMIWKRWLREYLPTLTTRSKWNRERPDLKEGDLVIIKNNDSPRSQWPLARVSKVVSGTDGRVRQVEVKTASGTLVRPVAKLCPLKGIFK